jgi:transcriptional repressor NrdR
MRCPRCTCQDDKVVDSRAVKEGAGVRRRRECLNCGHRFTTYEEIIQAELKVVKRKDNRREDFDREKLRRGVEMACWKRDIPQEQIDSIVNKVVSSLESDFEREVPSEEIGNRTMFALRELDKVAYVRFASVYRDFKDIDEFISEIRTMNGIRR